MNPELIYDLPERVYHADTATLSASGAKVLLGKRPPSPDSDALLFGRLVHILLLEPERLDEYVDLDPNIIGVKVDGTRSDNPRGTKAWKDAVFQAERDGLTIIDAGTLARARAVAQAVMDHPEAGRLLAMATATEVSAYADHPSGARVRARFDAVIPTGIVDVKTAWDANPDTFGKTVHSFGYHISAANYIDIAAANNLPTDDYLLVVAEKEPTPGGDYRVAVIELHPDAIDRGRQLMGEACERWLENDRRIDLPGYGDGRHVVDLPPYAYDNDFEDIQIGAAS